MPTSARSPKSPQTPDHNANKRVTDHATPPGKQSFPYPVCWSDDVRMEALLTQFRLRSLNPEHYDAKMKFWQDLIAQYCEHKGSACFCKRELQLMFSRGQRMPYCLDTVLEEMLRTKKIRLRIDYAYDPENTWTGWAMNSFVKKPLAWGFYKLKSSIGLTDESNLGMLEYVHLEIIKKFIKDLQRCVLQPHQGKLMHYEAFKELALDALGIEEDCLRLCVHTLHCQRKLGLEYKMEDKQQQIHLIKIPAKGDTNIAITETDHAVHNLRMTQDSLLKQIESLETEIKLNDEKARQYMQENKRQMAKTYLRKKHLLEKNHEKRSIALHNIESLLCSVDEAQNHGEILDAYKIGSKALQKALSDSGLKYDNVDEVISEVRDTMDAHREMQDTLANVSLANSSMAGDNNENDELERELQEILGEANDSQMSKKPTAVVTPKVNKNGNNTKLATNAAVSTPTKVQITDSELLEMLEGLEVEDNSPGRSETGRKDATLN